MDVRLTPADGQPIDFASVVDEAFNVFIAFQEGGTETCRLHYHVYCHTYRGETWRTAYWNKITRSTETVKGNAVYRSKSAHVNSIGYIVKGGNCVYRKGWDQTYLEERMELSKEYRMEKQREKNKAAKEREDLFKTIYTKVKRDMITDVNLRSPSSVITRILADYSNADAKFPPRSSVENAALTLLYPYHPDLVVAHYASNFRFFYQ